MKERDDKGGFVRSVSGSRRDDTPSVIQNVERLTSIPSRASLPNIPVLEMPRSQRIWRRVRIPFFVTIVAILLLTVAFVTYGIKVAASIANTIEEAMALEQAGTIEQTRVAEKMVATLTDRYPRDDNAAAGWGWQVVLQHLLYGEPLSPRASENLAEIDDSIQTSYAFAARAGRSFMGRDLSAARAEVDAGLARHPDDPRISLVQLLVLDKSGEQHEAWNRLMALLETQKEYVPLLVVGTEMALGNGNRLDARDLATLLLGISPDHLFGEMAIILLGLPAWGEADAAAEQLAVLKQKYSAIAPRLAAAPPKLKTIGHYLKGRLLLVAGEPAEAALYFEKALAENPNPETLAWYSAAVRLKGSVADALAVLDARAEIQGPQVYEARARLLLEHHRVDQAATAVAALEKTGVLSHRREALSWLLAVRKGDIEAAKSTLPEKISGDDKWPAIEMYYLAKRLGDSKGIAAVEKALEGEWGTCARVIRSWHSRSLRRATRLFGNKRVTCADDFMPRLMRGRIETDALLEAAEAVRRKSGGSLLFEVDRALAVWRAQGHAAGKQVLDRIRSLSPEGIPLRRELAAAYLDMDLPDDALAVIGDETDPELLSLRIFALEASNQKAAAEKLVETVSSKSDDHPAFAYFKLRALLRERSYEAIKSWADAGFDKKLYGEWTAELLEIVARALIALDLRSDAEDLTEKVAKHLLVPVGAGEAMEAWMADVKININRGGRNRNRALVIVRTLREEGVRDPYFSFWLGVESIVNGSERLGLKFIKEALTLDTAFKPAWAKMAEMAWMGEQTAARMRTMRPGFNPPGAPSE